MNEPLYPRECIGEQVGISSALPPSGPSTGLVGRTPDEQSARPPRQRAYTLAALDAIGARAIKTEAWDPCRTCLATLPGARRVRPDRPLEPSTTRSAFHCRAARTIAAAGSPVLYTLSASRPAAVSRAALCCANSRWVAVAPGGSPPEASIIGASSSPSILSLHVGEAESTLTTRMARSSKIDQRSKQVFRVAWRLAIGRSQTALARCGVGVPPEREPVIDPRLPLIPSQAPGRRRPMPPCTEDQKVSLESRGVFEDRFGWATS